jgi:UDP-N-acetylmuramate--alanine ligase
MDRPDLERTPAYPTTQSPKAHLVPDDEVGMVGLAGWLKAEGFDVSSAPSNARFDQAHRPASVPKSARWLVYAPDVPVEHRDRLVARREGIAESSYPAVLRDVLGRKLGIAIAGRRQGRLAAAMIGWTLTHAGFDPTVLLRGNVAQLGGAARSGRGAHAVADVTEALDEAILGEPSPQMAVMLDIEKIGSRRTQILERLAVGVGPEGYILAACGANSLDLSQLAPEACVESLSLHPGSTWWGADVREEHGCFRFRAFHRGRFAAEIRLKVPGAANVLSALATVAVCTRVDVPARAIKDAMEDFGGISRGFETRGSYRGVTLIDDDSVEPEDVAGCLTIARGRYGRRRIVTVFAPDRSPCGQTITALANADRIVLWDRSVDADDWAGMLEGAGVAALRVTNLDEALADLDQHLEPGDVLLTLGAGEVGTIADAFIRRLSRDRQGR